MKIIPADVELTSMYMEKDELSFSVTIPDSGGKYSPNVFNLVQPCIVVAVVDWNDEVDVEVRPFQYGVTEVFRYPAGMKYVFAGYDQGLLGGMSKPFNTGYTKSTYHYINAIFPGTEEFCAYASPEVKGLPSGDSYVISINTEAGGKKSLLIGNEWEIDNKYIIGGYL